MNEDEKAIDTRMRNLSAEMTKADGLKMLEIMLERNSVDEIANAIKLTKISREVTQICHQISNF